MNNVCHTDKIILLVINFQSMKKIKDMLTIIWTAWDKQRVPKGLLIIPYVILIGILIATVPIDLRGQGFTRDLNVDLLVNQSGYTPMASKFCVVQGKRNEEFHVINTVTGKVAFRGVFRPQKGDFGKFSVADFSSLTQEGHFYVRSGNLRSYPFEISKAVYRSAIDLVVHYFSLQRCGGSTTGYLTPCHLDDGIRLDNGEHQDVTGGWHDACDLRKWVDATIYGMIGLANTYDLQQGNKKFILDELRWGNKYFLAMQEPQGYVMSFVGGDVKGHGDSNRWTDNEIERAGGTPRFVVPDQGRSRVKMLVFGSSDDRVIDTDPLNLVGQYNFITAEAMMSRITAAEDAAYSNRCLLAAKKCFKWCTRSDHDSTSAILGAAIQATVELFKATHESMYKTHAVMLANRLKELQVINQGGTISGFFYTSFLNQEPAKNIWQGCLEFISLCDLVQAFPSDQHVPVWKTMIADYAYHYLRKLSQRNSFGLIPYGLYMGDDPGGHRRIGDYWYRYFMRPELDWWVGINSNIASAGVGLIKAANILHDDKLRQLAQRQLDWIIGANPFNSSTILTVGYNPPKLFINGGEFKPATPGLPGAVMNGLGGNAADQPVIGDGDWQISEYWTPMVSYTLWLMAEASAEKG